MLDRAIILILVFLGVAFATMAYAGYLSFIVGIITTAINFQVYICMVVFVGCILGIIGSFIYWLSRPE
jgi:hypothetical protein